MTEKYCELTKDSYTVFTHSTGLPVCVVSKPGHAKIHAMFAANFGSVDRVVLPVPDSPKNTAVFLPCLSVLAEQCIEAIPFSGRR